MTTIVRHDHTNPDPARILRMGLEDLAEHRDILAENPLSAGMMIAHVVGAAGAASVLGEPRAVQRAFLARAVELGRASFELAYDEGEVEITIDGAALRVPATGPTGYTEPATWHTVFGLALALRERSTVDYLASLDVVVMHDSATRVDDYRYAMMVAMQTFWRGGDWRPHAKEAVALSSDSGVGGADHVPAVLGQLALLDPIERNDAAAFSAQLTAALEAHRAHWGAKRWSGHLAAQLAVVPLGLAALAHDRGLSIDVESDYVPAWIIRGEWGA